MQKRSLVAVLALVAVSQLGIWCAGPVGIDIQSPGFHVEEFSFELAFELLGNFEPGSLKAKINGESILDRLTNVGPLYSGTIDPGSPLRNWNLLVVRAVDVETGDPVVRLRS